MQTIALYAGGGDFLGLSYERTDYLTLLKPGPNQIQMRFPSGMKKHSDLFAGYPSFPLLNVLRNGGAN